MTRRRLVIGPLAAAALALAACGSDDATGTPTTTTAAGPAAEQSTTGSAAATEPAPADGKVAATDSMMAMLPVEYVYEGEMPPLDGPAGAWRWLPGRTPTTEEIAAVAAALGVEGDVTEQPADMGGGWIVGAEGATRLTVGQDAQGSWSLIADSAAVCMDDTATTGPASSSAAEPDVQAVPTIAPDDTAGAAEGAPADPATPVAPPETVPCAEPIGIPTADEAQAKAIELLQALGLDPAGYELSADSQEWGAWVDARLLVDGIASPALTSFGFGPEGALTFASGQLFAPEPAGQYTRTGTAAALEQLQTDQFRSYSPAVDPAATDAAPVPASEPAADDGGTTASPVQPDTPVSAPGMPTDEATSPTVDAANPVETGAPIDTSTPPEPITVVLTGVEAGWWMIWADDGMIWLMPGYDFITDQGERISAPAVAQIDMPVVETMTGPGAGEAPAEPDIASPLGG